MASGSAAALKPRVLRRRSGGEAGFDAVNLTLLSLYCLTILYPFWSTLVLSFAPADEAGTLGFRMWNEHWTAGAYRFAFSEFGNAGVAYYNSIYRTVLGVGLTLAMTLLAAYPLAKRDLPGRKWITLYFLLMLFFSGGLIPRFLLVRGIGLLDTRWALILPLMAQAYFVIIMRNFLMTIDAAYEESAFIDGASYLQVLVRIIVPLAKPAIATIALWTAVLHWNSWFDALIYLTSESKVVLQTLLRRLVRAWEQETTDALDQFLSTYATKVPSEAAKAAVIVITIGPIIALYPFLQRYFIKGIFLGSLKG